METEGNKATTKLINATKHTPKHPQRSIWWYLGYKVLLTIYTFAQIFITWKVIQDLFDIFKDIDSYPFYDHSSDGEARGIIAIGDEAYGILAIGREAHGVFAIGQLAFGIFIRIHISYKSHLYVHHTCRYI